MKRVILINPGANPVFGGAYLFPWSGYDMTYAGFQQDGDNFSIVMMDRKLRPYEVKDVSEDHFQKVYWQLIRRGWRVMKQ